MVECWIDVKYLHSIYAQRFEERDVSLACRPIGESIRELCGAGRAERGYIVGQSAYLNGSVPPMRNASTDSQKMPSHSSCRKNVIL